jgi:hypothetical protein
VGGRRNAQSTSLLWEPQVGDAVGIDKGNVVVVVVLDVVVKSCNVKKDIPRNANKEIFWEEQNLVCRGNYSRTKGNVSSLKSGVTAVVRAMIALKYWVSGYAKLDRGCRDSRCGDFRAWDSASGCVFVGRYRPMKYVR